MKATDRTVTRRVLRYWTKWSLSALILLLIFGLIRLFRNWRSADSAALDQAVRDVPTSFALVFAGMVLFRLFQPIQFAGSDYIRWLASSPWQPGQRLPFVRFTLGAFDGLAIAIVTAVIVLGAHWILHFSLTRALAIAVIGLAIGYFIGQFVLLAWLKRRWLATALVVILTPVALREVGPVATLAALVSAAVLCEWGVRRGQRDIVSARLGQIGGRGWALVVANRTTARPLSPPVPGILSLANERYLARAFLLAWALAVFTHLLSRTAAAAGPEEVRRAQLPIVLCVSIVALVFYAGRMLSMNRYLRPPLYPLARLRTGYLVFPRFDIVLIAPLIGIVASLFLGFGLMSLRAPLSVTVLMTTMAIAIAARWAGPSRRQFDLTGHWQQRRTGSEISLLQRE